VIVEDNADKVISLSFVPIRGPPEPLNGRHMGLVFRDFDFENNFMMVFGRMEMVNNGEGFAAIQAAEAHQ
jgi:hypothetical protein